MASGKLLLMAQQIASRVYDLPEPAGAIRTRLEEVSQTKETAAACSSERLVMSAGADGCGVGSEMFIGLGGSR